MRVLFFQYIPVHCDRVGILWRGSSEYERIGHLYEDNKHDKLFGMRCVHDDEYKNGATCDTLFRHKGNVECLLKVFGVLASKSVGDVF